VRRVDDDLPACHAFRLAEHAQPVRLLEVLDEIERKDGVDGLVGQKRHSLIPRRVDQDVSRVVAGIALQPFQVRAVRIHADVHGGDDECCGQMPGPMSRTTSTFWILPASTSGTASLAA
jgi:hypothetical protein